MLFLFFSIYTHIAAMSAAYPKSPTTKCMQNKTDLSPS